MIVVKRKIGVPKYKQIINSIEQAIVSGTLQKGYQLPSVNSVKNKHKLSRDTVLMAYNDLKSRGIIQSVVGKGYYVTSENITVTQKIFLLFDELNAFKEDLYNAFLKHLGTHFQVDIYFHHFNKKMFGNLINANTGDYHFYVIMPANIKNTHKLIKSLPKGKVYILDQIHNHLLDYPAIYQNFEKAMFNNLNHVKKRLGTYNKLILIFDKEKQPQGMRMGFVEFCKKNAIPLEVIDSATNKVIEVGDLFIIPDDKNLLQIIKNIKTRNLVLAKDVGIISYNDTLLKEVVEGGISTISTDFTFMGKRLAEMILNNDTTQVENPSKLIMRNSF